MEAQAKFALAYQLIEDDAVGVFDDSNAGFAAALAAADLITGWNSYGAAYIAANAHEYQPHDVTEVIAQLTAWKKKGCPAPAPVPTREGTIRVEFLRAMEDHTWDTITVAVPLYQLEDIKVTEAGDDAETLMKWCGTHLRDQTQHRKVVTWAVYNVNAE